MNTGKVVANAGSHRILQALSTGPCESKELKNIVGAVNSIARFDGEYMERLIRSGYVKRRADKWLITAAGQEKLDELGPARGVRRRNQPTNHARLMDRETYQPSKELKPPMRPGSEDFLQYPTRMGNKLYYRDGTVKDAKHGH